MTQAAPMSAALATTRDKILRDKAFIPHRSSAIDRGMLARAMRTHDDALAIITRVRRAAVAGLAAELGISVTEDDVAALAAANAKLEAALAASLVELAGPGTEMQENDGN